MHEEFFRQSFQEFFYLKKKEIKTLTILKFASSNRGTIVFFSFFFINMY